MSLVKSKWLGLVSDAIHAFRPGWHWTEISNTRLQRGLRDFEKDVLQLGDEDWYLGMILRPSGWQMSVIRDQKVICSTYSGQFQVLFGIWSRLWAGKAMLSRLQWERKYDWSPGKQIIVGMGPVNFGRGGPYDNWRELARRRTQEAADLIAQAERRKLQPRKPIQAALPGGTIILKGGGQVPSQFLPYLTSPFELMLPVGSDELKAKV